jgi:hypothetical protein
MRENKEIFRIIFYFSLVLAFLEGCATVAPSEEDGRKRLLATWMDPTASLEKKWDAACRLTKIGMSREEVESILGKGAEKATVSLFCSMDSVWHSYIYPKKPRWRPIPPREMKIHYNELPFKVLGVVKKNYGRDAIYHFYWNLFYPFKKGVVILQFRKLPGESTGFSLERVAADTTQSGDSSDAGDDEEDIQNGKNLIMDAWGALSLFFSRCISAILPDRPPVIPLDLVSTKCEVGDVVEITYPVPMEEQEEDKSRASIICSTEFYKYNFEDANWEKTSSPYPFLLIEGLAPYASLRIEPGCLDEIRMGPLLIKILKKGLFLIKAKVEIKDSEKQTTYLAEISTVLDSRFSTTDYRELP